MFLLLFPFPDRLPIRDISPEVERRADGKAKIVSRVPQEAVIEGCVHVVGGETQVYMLGSVDLKATTHAHEVRRVALLAFCLSKSACDYYSDPLPCRQRHPCAAARTTSAAA